MPRAIRSVRLRLVVFLAASVLLTACDHFTVADAGTVPDTPQLTPAPAATLAADAPTCPTIETGGAAVVDTLRSSDGACIPIDRAVAYRCDPALDPVAVLDLHGERRRFLGGRFAVAVPSLPDGAHALGITSFGRVFDVPTEPTLLFVETPAGYQRWVSLPDPGTVEASPTVHLIGDSILDGAAETLLARFPSWALAIDAEIGRSTSGGAAAAEASAPITSDLVVIELGVNDVDADATLANARRIVAAAQADGLLWVNAHGPDPETDAVNDAIEAVVAGVPSAALVDWDAQVPAGALSSDGVHLLDGTGTPFVDVLAPLMEAWHEAAIGRGADRCGAAVLDAS